MVLQIEKDNFSSGAWSSFKHADLGHHRRDHYTFIYVYIYVNMEMKSANARDAGHALLSCLVFPTHCYCYGSPAWRGRSEHCRPYQGRRWHLRPSMTHLLTEYGYSLALGAQVHDGRPQVQDEVEPGFPFVHHPLLLVCLLDLFGYGFVLYELFPCWPWVASIPRVVTFTALMRPALKAADMSAV